MTNPLRVFAKLAARVPPFATMGGSTGAPEVDAATAAALCAGMPEHWYRAALFKFALDRSAQDWIRIELMRAAMEASQQRWMHDKDWRPWAEHIKAVTGKAASCSLADMVILETVEPARFGSVEQKTTLLQVSERTWHRRIRPRYNEVAMLLDEWSNNAVRYVWRAQAEDEVA